MLTDRRTDLVDLAKYVTGFDFLSGVQLKLISRRRGHRKDTRMRFSTFNLGIQNASAGKKITVR